MTTSIRELLLANADPRAPSPQVSAKTPSIAGPMELLGVAPRNDVVFLSPAARALSSPEAAQVQGFPPPPPPDGLGIDVVI